MGFWNWFLGKREKETPTECRHDWEVKEFPAVGVKLFICRGCQERLLDLHGSLWKPWEPEPEGIETLITQGGGDSCPSLAQ